MSWARTNIFVILIFSLAILLRFWQLGQIPASLNWDEVAYGNNAYSISIDGKDEFGQFLPFKYLESYGDYKPPLYAYLTVIPVKVFGLNEFSVRFASAFFGSLTVLITYFLVRQLFYKSKQRDFYAIFSMLLLAISPWHVSLSHAAYEANVATFFIVSGVWLFLSAIHGNRALLVLSAVSFALSLYTFNTARIVVPIFVLILAGGFRHSLLKMTRWVVVAVVIGSVITFPLIPFLLSPQAELRYKEVNIFSNPELIKTANQMTANDGNVVWSKILHNRRVIYAQEYLKHYFDNFNPNFLFISGDENHRFGTKDVGLLYIWEIPFILIGIIALLRNREGSWWVIPVWILVGVIPAATARETPHALRIETIIPSLQILSAIGVVTALGFAKNVLPSKNIRYSVISLIFLALFINALYFVHGYYRHYPRESAGDWQYGYKEAVLYTQQVADEYEQINFTNNIGRPYAYVLFYTQPEPEEFRKQAVIDKDVFGFVDVKEFGKYHFTNDVKSGTAYPNRTLYIDIPKNVPKNAKILKYFKYPDGYKRLVAYTLD
jgi:4-amino-4-deoxy-L-arabinose transferase-like glycosyltransferase